MKTIEIRIPVGTIELPANLNIPADANSIVLFSHGSGSGRLSTRNNYVADKLNKANIATLLFDLLTDYEEEIPDNRFNIDLLTERLVGVTEYVQKLPAVQDLTVGYFGASTGAASALKAAAQLDQIVRAVVSRGGRPDLAKSSLKQVKAPTLLIIGSLDKHVIELNEEAYSQLKCEKKIQIVNGATHLFEEPGKLDEVAALATDWFKKYIHNFKSKKYVV